uniref:Uncharacterized protein n=1 Tax=Anguilla anguilla TaxID=7936 RepID=A0A0E9TJ13_ANGAN
MHSKLYTSMSGLLAISSNRPKISRISAGNYHCINKNH